MTEAGRGGAARHRLRAFGEGYIRISFANSEENLSEALRRIDSFNRTLLHK